MKKTTIIILVSIFLLIFFFLPIIPSDVLPKTPEQEVFCQEHGCGLNFMYTPFKFVKILVTR
ncbi:MAG: hypothetical protein NTW62_03470 [Candidatus Nomurabacteria bacterium]|nr:hypothetical protein [Candidatus Nomurabacteria bacterium]